MLDCSWKSHFGHGFLEAHCESHAPCIWPGLHQSINWGLTERYMVAFYSDLPLEPWE